MLEITKVIPVFLFLIFVKKKKKTVMNTTIHYRRNLMMEVDLTKREMIEVGIPTII